MDYLLKKWKAILIINLVISFVFYFLMHVVFALMMVCTLIVVFLGFFNTKKIKYSCSRNNVVVEIDTSIATEILYAMLHVDAGSEGDYEFPGEDTPASDADGNVVTPSFTLLGEIDY